MVRGIVIKGGHLKGEGDSAEGIEKEGQYEQS